MPAMPRVLFVDDDDDALQMLLVRIEATFLTASLRSAAPMWKYTEEFKPDVLVISDQLRHGRHDAKALIGKLRERGFKQSVLVLTDHEQPGDEARWQEWGANGVALHPTRVEKRLDRMAMQLAILAGAAR